jgi:hypothetical protein
MLGMNLAGGLQALGVEGAGHWAGRDKAPFRMLVGLPPAANPLERRGMDTEDPEDPEDPERRMGLPVTQIAMGGHFVG